MYFSKRWCLLSLILLVLVGCVNQQINPFGHSPLTQGNVQLSLQKGVTTQDDVLQAFGPPNIATINADGQEIWTYQQQAANVRQESHADFLTIILLNSSSRHQQTFTSMRTITLTITFEQGIVIDFKSLSTQF